MRKKARSLQRTLKVKNCVPIWLLECSSVLLEVEVRRPAHDVSLVRFTRILGYCSSIRPPVLPDLVGCQVLHGLPLAQPLTVLCSQTMDQQSHHLIAPSLALHRWTSTAPLEPKLLQSTGSDRDDGSDHEDDWDVDLMQTMMGCMENHEETHRPAQQPIHCVNH